MLLAEPRYKFHDLIERVVPRVLVGRVEHPFLGARVALPLLVFALLVGDDGVAVAGGGAVDAERVGLVEIEVVLAPDEGVQLARGEAAVLVLLPREPVRGVALERALGRGRVSLVLD